MDFGTSFNRNPKIVKGKGDGHVNERSLLGCNRWIDTLEQGNHKIYQKEYPNLDHFAILDDLAPINYILRTVKTYQKVMRENCSENEDLGP